MAATDFVSQAVYGWLGNSTLDELQVSRRIYINQQLTDSRLDGLHLIHSPVWFTQHFHVRCHEFAQGGLYVFQVKF